MNKIIKSLLQICFAFPLFFSFCKEAPAPQVVEKFSTDELSVQHGMSLFNQNCASCHSFEENGIGPNLTGITRDVQKDWLKKFIHNPISVIQSGDERAKGLFTTYKQYMPPFASLQDAELEHLLGFIHKFSDGASKNKNNRPGGLIDPIKEKIQESDLVVEIKKIMTLPYTAEKSPLARINKMAFIKTKSGSRNFILDLRGTLYEMVKDTVQIYFDLKSLVPKFIDNPGLATGFGSFAFHPEFEKNGLLYTTHTEPPKTAPADFPIDDSIKVTVQWVLTEWKTKAPSSKVFEGTAREIMRVDMYSGIHGFQDLSFNPYDKNGEPDFGMLYLGIGEGGSAVAGYPYLCDNNRKIWGSIIRIDPSKHDSKNGQYGIPSDNPFLQENDAVKEIWARGFRNPHIFTWDRHLGMNTMFVTNIGQHSIEELNLVLPGKDYGWPNREGSFLYDVFANTEIVYPLPAQDSLPYEYPVLQFDHDEGNAICGGYVYHGKIKALQGKYIFGDIPRGTLFFTEANTLLQGQQARIFKMKLKYADKLTNLETVTGNTRVDLRFGMDAEGELYIFTKSNATIYKVIGCKKGNEKEI
ncbi:MAG: PQQ-dependent sugar dehydrogenase [Saprospiraceae bacterium]